ncbi:hypothetical protein WOLCODRAFT_124744 [Wolfiporia cocos MD-104 SS10]|uniref:F-box domain-containing protein n=1 Tax=Wolfiporia cocos (strain MD-104) TaxID=742152 RepID=A0A2H3JAB8_WOLCO|nr:hypothetical protein WOLCODRAFT_124744 [Wolfiporia cocos MD-104 SS10]
MLSLPPELVENILICIAAMGFPTAIAALAQTCRFLRDFIDGATDHHLWRNIFLTSFDDPRELIYTNKRKFACRSGHDRPRREVEWAAEFKRRVWTKHYIARHTQPLHVQKVYGLRSRAAAVSQIDLSPTFDSDSILRALRTILSVMQTTLPPNQTSQGVLYLSDNTSSRSGNSAFPENYSLSKIFHSTTEYPIINPDPTPSLNIPWLESTLQRGLPAALIARLSGDHVETEWEQTLEAQALGEIICCTGFLPVRELREERIGRLASSAASNNTGKSNPNITSLDMSVDAQKARARHRAREHVYDMQYLHRRRCWGPFLLVPKSSASAGPRSTSVANAGDVPSRNWPSSDVNEPYSSESDSDFVPPDDASQTSWSTNTERDDAAEQRRHLPLPGGTKKRELPTNEQLIPDWTWLASARIISEANLRDWDSSRVDEFVKGQVWRAGFWSQTEIERDRLSDGVLPPAAASATGNSSATQTVYHDWAGVGGIWRRCVSWLGYEDLVQRQWDLNHAMEDPTIFENMRIVPLRLRVVGYDPPATSAFPDRPTLKIEGESGGPDWAGSPDGEGDDVRRIHGSVSMLADGHVRWSLFTVSENPQDGDEYASEGIQIGGVGSDAGFIGLWTGATHTDGDPIGPFWQWRVA